jgi:hypothetical protein
MTSNTIATVLSSASEIASGKRRADDPIWAAQGRHIGVATHRRIRHPRQYFSGQLKSEQEQTE